MLSSVHIENIALINKLDVDFKHGFTVLTGETGAGKSILIDSINVVSGARMNKELIRSGAENCFVSAMFCDIDAKTKKKIEELGISVDGDNTLLIQRTLYLDGRSVSKINMRTVPQSVVRIVAALLINIYGQHDFYYLLDPKTHIDYIDSFANSFEDKMLYKAEYDKLCDINSQIKNLGIDMGSKQQKIELIKYQIEDISAARLKSGEEELLQSEKIRLLNYEKISSAVNKTYAALYGSNSRSAYSLISIALSNMEELCEIIPEIKGETEKLNEYLYEIEAIAQKINNYSIENEEDPTVAIDKIEVRLDLIYRLKKKYGNSVDDILNYLEKIRKELENISLSDEKLKQLSEKREEQLKIVAEYSAKLSAVRKKAALKLEGEISEQFAFLDMPGVIFKANFEKETDDSLNTIYFENGMDIVEFLMSTNPGEPLKPMSKIASGGELSRIMLAIKGVLALNDDIQTIIFDEIDTGISGKTSQKVGINLKKLSKSLQVFCVTHSAQVASLADNHYKIEKNQVNSRMETSVKLIYADQREDEIARILGGIDITESAKKTAAELIEQGKKY